MVYQHFLFIILLLFHETFDVLRDVYNHDGSTVTFESTLIKETLGKNLYGRYRGLECVINTEKCHDSVNLLNKVVYFQKNHLIFDNS